MESYVSVDEKGIRSEESTSTASNHIVVRRSPRRRGRRASSASSISGQPGYEYDVFLNFRGSDTREGFTNSLYTALKGARIRAFRDNDELNVGEEIGNELLYAIKHSNISIPIISKDYASSKWCLKELAFMMECRETRNQIVLPVFYKVTPNEVQLQTGEYYATAFQQHAQKQDSETVERWRRALSQVGSLAGWEVKNENDRFQEKLISTIVTKVLMELKMTYLSLNKNLVGIDDKLEVVMRMLALEAQDVRFVGICGMGGIGKTTLAKLIYNKILIDFDTCCFLEDIQEISSRSANGLQQLQTQLVVDLMRCSSINFATIEEGIHVLKWRFREKKVLILLDDVSHVVQLKALAAGTGWFGLGSRIIITTRSKNVLNEAQIHHIYDVEELGTTQALQLFCKHTLRSEAPTIKLRHLSEEIVKATGGLPLALEVIGSFLHGKNVAVWNATSQKLKKVPNTEVEHKLMISYNALDHEQQQMFLDVACLFIKEDKRTVAYFWEDSNKFSYGPDADIDVLQLLSLIKLGDDGRLHMHSQLRDLGRRIVRRENYDEPGKRSRLWGREAIDVLQSRQGSNEIKAIRLEYLHGLEDCYFTPDQFKKLSSLSFLHLDCANLDGNFEHLLPQLKWLRWKVSRFRYRATNLSPKSLLILDLSGSRVTHNWNLWNTIEMAMKVKVLDLNNCDELIRTPGFHTFCNLERINLRYCGRLEVIDPSIEKLEHLSFLNLEGCRHIKELPEQLRCMETLQELVIDGTRMSMERLPKLDNFKKLKILSARNCEYLTKIPSSICHLTSLSHLIFDESKIRELPQSIGSLGMLRRLTLGSTPVKELPTSIGELKSLVELSLSKTKVAILPDSLANLSNLEVLRIDRSLVRCLPAALGQLTNLRHIDATKCLMLGEISSELGGLCSLKVLLLRHTNITRVPETITGLPCLERLDLAWCTKLQTLPQLPSNLSSMSVTCQSESSLAMSNLPSLINLRKLEIVGSTVTKEVSELPKLEKLYISRSNASILVEGSGAFTMLKELFIGNIDLECLPRLPSGLHTLSIFRCHSLTRLSGLSNLQNLSKLLLFSCPKLMEIEGLGDLPMLGTLHISSCEIITELRGLEMLEPLKVLHIESCGNLEVLPYLSRLSGLKWMKIYDVPTKTLSGLSCLNLLRELHLEGCSKLRGLEGLDELQSLGSLNISYCREIERLPNLSRLNSLQWLEIYECEKLKGLDGLEKLESFKFLRIQECKSIKKLPNLSKLKLLQYLSVAGCVKLEGLLGLEGLKRLDILVISRCKAIERLPDLSYLESLTELHAEDCEKLQSLEGLDRLCKLVELHIKGCKSLQKLPDLSNLTLLRYFDANGCEKLQQVQGVSATKMVQLPLQNGWDQWLEADDIEKLQELEDILAMMGVDISYNRKASREILEGSNLGVLRRWYADGCDNIPQLERLEELEMYHLRVNPHSNVVEIYEPYTGLRRLSLSLMQ